MIISVFGLGYVGLVNIACLAKRGHRLKGCDIKSGKVRQLQSGESPIYEPGLQGIIAEYSNTGKITAHHSAQEAIEGAEAAIVCVGTPSMTDGTVELGYIKNTLMELAKLAHSNPTLQHIIVRSTIPPGTMREIAVPLFVKSNQVQLYFIPEFLREGSAIDDFFHSARTVIGTQNGQEAEAAVQQLFDTETSGPVFSVDFHTAEFIKYVDNAWHAIKVAFANEAYSIGNAFGVDIPKANEIFLEDKHLNICEKYLKPGLPFGGSCLPKDVRAINRLASKAQIKAPLMNSMLSSNAEHKARLSEFVLANSGGHIVMQGLTFKADTDDLRESPLVDLARDIIAAGRELTIIDSHVNIESLRTQFPDLGPYFAPIMRELPKPSEKVSLVISKGGGTDLQLHAEPIIDLTFRGIGTTDKTVHRWVMG